MRKLLGKLFMDLDKIATPSARSVFLSQKSNLNEQIEKEFLFFSSVKLENGVTKTTARSRMGNVDEWFSGFLRKGETQRVLDVGVSSGITTVELCSFFDSQNISYHVTAMDSDITAFLVILSEQKSVLLDKNGNPIHFEIDGKGFGYIKGTNAKHRLDRTLLERQAKSIINPQIINELMNDKTMIKKGGVEIHPIELVCREIKDNERVGLLEESIFSDNIAGKYNFIRAANILNNGYFNEQQLTHALQNLRKTLEVNGFFLVCRTNFEGQNNATLFTLMEDNKFEVVSRLGDGAEIESLVLGLTGI